MRKVFFTSMIFASALVMSNCGKRPNKPVAEISQETLKKLKVEDIKVGTGELIVKNDKIVVHYKGWLTDGTEFANTYKNGSPLTVFFGNRALIVGWEEGLKGMRMGGIRKLTIPPELAYGDKKLRNIPPNSTLIFEVKLVDILH